MSESEIQQSTVQVGLKLGLLTTRWGWEAKNDMILF